jgi:alginate O-acetyltransferase complex protein AlgI
MLFVSWPFVVLMGTTFCLFHSVTSQTFQTAVLIAASAVFYGYGQPTLLTLLVGSAVINGLASYAVRCLASPRQRFAVAAGGVALNLGILGLFKYGGLLGAALGPALHAPPSAVDWRVALPLPIGVSFYTFQGISLVVDEYRGVTGASGATAMRGELAAPLPRFMADTLLFIMLFPQLVAGPILKAHDFYPQIAAKRLADVNVGYAFKALVSGYFLKMVVADNLAEQTFWMRALLRGPVVADPGHAARGLFSSNLRRLCRLFADRAGLCCLVWLPALRQLQLPVHRLVFFRLLAAVAYLVVIMASRVSVHPVWG